MKRAISTTIAATALSFASAAQAGTGVYKTTGGDSTNVGTAESMGNMQVGTSVVTMDDGSSRNENWTCIGTSQPPNAKIFDMHFVCDIGSDAGTYSVSYGCQVLNPENETLGCVGGLRGKTGVYEGMGGATTWSGTNGTGMGTLQWQKMAE